MGTVRNQTNSVLREFVQGELNEEQLQRKLRGIARRTKSANPHNIGMTTLAFANKGYIDEETERCIYRVLTDTFPESELPGNSSELVDSE